MTRTFGNFITASGMVAVIGTLPTFFSLSSSHSLYSEAVHEPLHDGLELSFDDRRLHLDTRLGGPSDSQLLVKLVPKGGPKLVSFEVCGMFLPSNQSESKFDSLPLARCSKPTTRLYPILRRDQESLGTKSQNLSLI